jgi:hypothetical protein
LEQCAATTLNEREIHWVSFYNSAEKGYNLTEGGNNGTPSEETRLKLSKSHMGQSRPCSEKTKEIMRKRMTGRTILPEWREKLRLANIGKKHSEETKKTMSLSQKGNRGSSGKHWITNGQTSRQIDVNIIPDGWRKGRLIQKVAVSVGIQAQN